MVHTHSSFQCVSIPLNVTFLTSQTCPSLSNKLNKLSVN